MVFEGFPRRALNNFSMTKPSPTENIIISILVLIGLVIQLVTVLTRLFPLNANISARNALLGLTISSGLTLAYIRLLMVKRFSRLWTWCTFGLLFASVTFITYLQM